MLVMLTQGNLVAGNTHHEDRVTVPVIGMSALMKPLPSLVVLLWLLPDPQSTPKCLLRQDLSMFQCNAKLDRLIEL